MLRLLTIAGKEFLTEAAKHVYIEKLIDTVKGYFNTHPENTESYRAELESLTQELNSLDQKTEIQRDAVRHLAVTSTYQGMQLNSLKSLYSLLNAEIDETRTDQNERIDILADKITKIILNDKEKYKNLNAQLSNINEFLQANSDLTNKFSETIRTGRTENLEKFHKKIKNVQKAFLFFSDLGDRLDNQGLKEIAGFGLAATQIFDAGAALLSAEGLSFAVLGSVASMGMGAIALISLFSKRKKSGQDAFALAMMQNLRIISEQILKLHSEMRELFAQNFENQRAIYQAVVDGFTQLEALLRSEIHDFRIPMTLALDRIETNLNQLGKTLVNDHKNISLQPFRRVLSQANNYLRGSLQANPEIRIEEIANELVDWIMLNGESTSPLHTGANWLTDHNSENSNPMFNKLLKNVDDESLTHLLGYLANVAVLELGVNLIGTEVEAAELKMIQLNPIVITDNNQQTLMNEKLLYAAQRGNVAEVIEALHAGANIEAQLAENNQLGSGGFKGYTPLSLAAFFGRADVVKVLLKHGANVNAKTAANQGLLYLAAHTGQTKIIRYLFSVKKKEMYEQLNAQNHDNDTPLHSATYANSIATAKLLLELGADKSLTNAHGKTAIDLATKSNFTELAHVIGTYMATQSEQMAKAVFNLIIWLAGVKAYINLRDSNLGVYIHDQDNHQLNEIIASGKENIKFIRSLQLTPKLYQTLFTNYTKATVQIQQLMQKALADSGIPHIQAITPVHDLKESSKIFPNLPIQGQQFHALPRNEGLRQQTFDMRGTTFDFNSMLDPDLEKLIAEKFPALIAAYQLGLLTFDIKYNVTLESLSYRNDISAGPDHDRIACVNVEIGIRYSVHQAALHLNYSVHLDNPTHIAFGLEKVDHDTAALYVGPSLNAHPHDLKIDELAQKYWHRKRLRSISEDNIDGMVTTVEDALKNFYKDHRKQTISNLLTKGKYQPALEAVCNQLDETVAHLRAFAHVAGFKKEELLLIDQLWDPKKIKNYLQHYIDTADAQTPLPNLSFVINQCVVVMESILAKVSPLSSDYFESQISNQILAAMLNLNILKIKQNELMQQEENIAQNTQANEAKNKFPELNMIIENYLNNQEIWTSKNYLSHIPKEETNGKLYASLINRINVLPDMINQINTLATNNHNPKFIITALQQLNENCKRIHEALMHLSTNYPYGKDSFDFLISDTIKLKELDKKHQEPYKPQQDQPALNTSALFARRASVNSATALSSQFPRSRI